MSQSRHDFLFGAFDPLGTITVDKLPGALWVQALSLRIFGFHIWAVVLPQIAEGVLSVLVLYRAVRRLAGPVAGIGAAIVLAATPVTMELNRGNVSDSLLILLTVLAADATSLAIITGRLRTLLLAGFWVGLAFQAKMLQAWFVAPAFALSYLLSAPARCVSEQSTWPLPGADGCRVAQLDVGCLVGAGERSSLRRRQPQRLTLQPIFVYNGYARLGRSETRATIGQSALLRGARTFARDLNTTTATIRPSWHRILTGRLGRDIGWLLPAAGSLLLLVWERRRAGRRDQRLICLVLWSAWLLIWGELQ